MEAMLVAGKKVSVVGGGHRGEERNVRKIELRKMKEGRVRG